MTEIIGINIAILVVTISIIISGILLGIGKSFSMKRIELFGLEELIQSIINAALIGGIYAIIETVQTVSRELSTSACPADSMILSISCSFSNLSASLNLFSIELSRLLVMMGYYQSLVLNFSQIQIQPFANLSSISNVFSAHLLLSNLMLILIDFNFNILSFFAQNSLMLILPIGLVLRSFFATRKIGGFLIALSFGLYLLYPGFIMIFPIPQEELQNSTLNLQAVTNNSNYAPIPIIDLNDNYAVGSRLDNMSQSDFSGELTLIMQSNSNVMSKIILYAVFAPLFSLLVTLVFIKGLGEILGGSFSLSLVGVV